MTRQRRVFFLILCAFSCVWAAAALFAQSIRFEHRNLILAIRGAEGEKPTAPDDAISNYRLALRFSPCNATLQRELVLLLAYKEAVAMALPDIDTADATAKATQSAIGNLLACTPMDGKAWLDFALVDIHREGFSPRAAAAYAMSENVSPGESWLAKKRLLFALQFQPVFDAKAKAIARADLNTLNYAHGIHLKAVLMAAKTDKAGLDDLFAAPASP